MSITSLREEIRQKNLQSIKVSLKNELSLVDFAHVSTLFFGINAKSLKLKSLVQPKMFYKLLQESKPLKYDYYLVHFELLYRDIHNLEILSHEDLDFVKIKTKETALLPSDNLIRSNNKIFLKKNLQL